MREFAADVVHMPMGKKGLRYIVDMRKKFSGWLEAKALRKASSKAIAEMIFEVMTQFGCFPKITVDNGMEFKGPITLLADKYNILIIPISPYNPSANDIIERGHGVYIESIWKILQGNTAKWPEILPLTIWADQVTAKRMTGSSPYYLLYGQQPLFPFYFTDRTWHMLDWVDVNSTKDLLAIRAKQLSCRDEYIGEASAKAEKARLKAAEYFFQKNKARMTSGDYENGTMVLVWNNALDFTFGNKGALRWSGPYIVVQRRPSGAYVLAELDGTVLSKPFATCRLKLYHYHDANEPIVQFEWKHNIDIEITDSNDEDSEISEKGNFSTDNISRVAVNSAKKDMQPRIPRPWELRGKDADEYWQRIYQDVISGEMKKRTDAGRLAPWEEELIQWMETTRNSGITKMTSKT